MRTPTLDSNPSLSGTIPTELGSLTQLQPLQSNPSLSGTIPTSWAASHSCRRWPCKATHRFRARVLTELGSLTQLQWLALQSNPSLSGTIPTELGSLTQLQSWPANQPVLSGTMTELDSLTQLQLALALAATRRFRARYRPSWAAPHSCSGCTRWANPLPGTIPTELGSLTQLQQLALYSNPAGLSGSVPALEQSTVLEVVDLHNCSFTALPTSLPESLTHLYLNHNPIDAQPSDLSSLLDVVTGLHVLDVGFINSRVQLQYTTGGSSFGTRVSNPSPCHIAAPCAFVLTLYDDNDQPVNQGGLLHNLTLNLGDLHTPMIDNHDGTFVASIPHGWIRNVGSYTFEFVHDGQEFRPMMDGPQTVATADDCAFSPSAGKFGGVCKGLRTVKFLPRECAPSSTRDQMTTVVQRVCVCLATVPTATGATTEA